MTESSTGVGDRFPAVHRPVLLREVLDALAIESGQIVLDGTVGAGGHSRKILEQLGTAGTLIGLDRDPMMLEFARKHLAESQQDNFDLKQNSYSEMNDALASLNIEHVDRVLLDLGLSSDQLNDRDRGFGIETDGLFDLRFDTSSGKPAWRLIEELSETEIADIIHNFGEERHSRRIASEFQHRKKQSELKTAAEVADAVTAAISRQVKADERKKSVIRVFQAFRIAANDELGHLETFLNSTIHAGLVTGGRVAVISFHSLEDRLVKTAFRDKERWQNLTTKPITAGSVEKRMNPRCRTAKLRAAIRK